MIFYRRVKSGDGAMGGARKFDPTKTIFTAELFGPIIQKDEEIDSFDDALKQ